MVNFKERYPVDVAFVIRQRLADLGCEQRDLARAAAVTESYISQLLTRKKAPPAPNRTDIYDRMDTFLQLPRGELAKLVDLQRQEELQEKLGEPPAPLFQDMRALMLRKCPRDKEPYIRTIFAKQPFGELERLVTQKLLEGALPWSHTMCSTNSLCWRSSGSSSCCISLGPHQVGPLHPYQFSPSVSGPPRSK